MYNKYILTILLVTKSSNIDFTDLGLSDSIYIPSVIEDAATRYLCFDIPTIIIN